MMQRPVEPYDQIGQKLVTGKEQLCVYCWHVFFFFFLYIFLPSNQSIEGKICFISSDVMFALLLLLQKFDEAANSFYEGVKLDPENKELVNAFRFSSNTCVLSGLTRL